MITVSTIANATEIQLLCVTYELFLDDIKKVIDSEGEVRNRYLTRAKETLMVLTENLNFEVALARNLFDLYVYVQNTLINHSATNDKLEEVYRLIDAVYQGYLQLSEQEKENTPTMVNTQMVYAGMTYGKGYLNEYTDEEPGRGFKA